jgi:predicted dehydrogenase/aryl-alcohol dehydrogenase-like predicted oxidoreductase
LVAVGSRSPGTADAFGRAHGVDRRHASYEALLADDDVDVVYISTPHPSHARWAVLAAEAGKHVLCEKPLTLHHADSEAVIEAARRHGVLLMEAFMYRCHPQTLRLQELLRDGAVGEVRVIEAVHSFKGSADPTGRLLANDLGGGAILDVGCYCMSGARLVAGEEPEVVTGTAHVGPTGVDETAVASLRFPSGIVAHLSTGVRVDQAPALRVHGTEGSLTVTAPWLPGIDGGRRTEIGLARAGRASDVIEVHADRGLYAIEADEVAECIERGEAESPRMSWADTLGNAAALDRWRLAVGVVYDAEKPANLRTPVHGRPVAVRAPGSMPAGAINGVGRPVSRLVMGTMLAEGDHTWPMAMAVFDEFFERGGNTFDSARRYGDGESDRALGHWMETRGVRDATVVIAKGAHTPHCDPDTLTRELLASLDDLRTDRADLYFLHRDNLAVPVGEFVDVLNEHRRAGRIDAFGGSNWTAARIDAANAYAATNGLTGFSAVSNQFSLARMLAPTFPGCVGANEPSFREWVARTGTPVVAWSSQAAGFFAHADAADLRHAWHDEGNYERRARAEKLAAELGVGATTIALAWVLSQPLPIFPVIGPRSLAELRTTMDALAVELTTEQLTWLDPDS